VCVPRVSLRCGGGLNGSDAGVRDQGGSSVRGVRAGHDVHAENSGDQGKDGAQQAGRWQEGAGRGAQ